MPVLRYPYRASFVTLILLAAFGAGGLVVAVLPGSVGLRVFMLIFGIGLLLLAAISFRRYLAGAVIEVGDTGVRMPARWNKPVPMVDIPFVEITALRVRRSSSHNIYEVDHGGETASVSSNQFPKSADFVAFAAAIETRTNLQPTLA